MAKILLKETPNKKRPASLGDRVRLTGDYWSSRSSSENPYFRSGYACDGVVVEESPSVGFYVEWDNGKMNSYPVNEITIIEEIELPPTRSIVRINIPVTIGNVEILKRNSRMYIQGDYAHDENGLIFIKLDSKLLPKKMFNHKQN